MFSLKNLTRTPFLALVLLIVVLYSNSAFARSVECANFGKPALDVKMVSISQEPEYIFDQSSSDIARIGMDAPPGEKTHGLTWATFELDLDIAFSSQAVEGGVCVAPYQIVVKNGYPTMRVYVDNAYPRGSCQSRTILIHEKKHVAFDQQVLIKFQPVFKLEISRALLAMDLPNYYPTLNDAKKDISEKLKQALQSVGEQLRIQRNELNNSIDTPASYFDTSQECGSW